MKTTRIFGLMVLAAVAAAPVMAEEKKADAKPAPAAAKPAPAAAPAAAAPAAAPAAAAGALDGKTFNTTFTMGDKSGPNDLVFAAGHVESTECTKNGYGKGAYTTKTEGDKTMVEATLSKGADTHKLTATITGDAIEGKMVMTEGGKTTEGTFKGTLKK